MTTGQMGQLYDQLARQAVTPGEKLEMIALKSLSTNSQEELFKEFGFDSRKVTFEAERYLGKEVKVSKKPDGSSASRLDTTA